MFKNPHQKAPVPRTVCLTPQSEILIFFALENGFKGSEPALEMAEMFILVLADFLDCYGDEICLYTKKYTVIFGPLSTSFFAKTCFFLLVSQKLSVGSSQCGYVTRAYRISIKAKTGTNHNEPFRRYEHLKHKISTCTRRGFFDCKKVWNT